MPPPLLSDLSLSLSLCEFSGLARPTREKYGTTLDFTLNYGFTIFHFFFSFGFALRLNFQVGHFHFGFFLMTFKTTQFRIKNTFVFISEPKSKDLHLQFFSHKCICIQSKGCYHCI